MSEIGRNLIELYPCFILYIMWPYIDIARLQSDNEPISFLIKYEVREESDSRSTGVLFR